MKQPLSTELPDTETVGAVVPGGGLETLLVALPLWPREALVLPLPQPEGDWLRELRVLKVGDTVPETLLPGLLLPLLVALA